MTEPASMSEPRRAPSSLAAIVGRLAHAMTSGAMGTGDVAELRRVTVDAPDRPAFWRALATYIQESPDDPRLREGAETRWAIVLSGMARMMPRPHDPARPVGRTLAQAGFHELRLLRLLRSQGPGFAVAVRRACGFLAAKRLPINWVELTALVLTTEPGTAETLRRRIARDYYATVTSKGGTR